MQYHLACESSYTSSVDTTGGTVKRIRHKNITTDSSVKFAVDPFKMDKKTKQT